MVKSEGVSTFKVTFTRFHNGERRHSAPEFVHAPDFADAHDIAEYMVRAMRMADPDSTFEILKVEDMASPTAQACVSGFETDSEFSERAKREYPNAR
jgi:hypothetical protein